MEKHHQESIDKFLEAYINDPSMLGILLGGSIAHGFDQPESDIDILLLVEPVEYEERKTLNKLAFSLRDICTYENGYIDCKVISIELLTKVLKTGSDPARYAFKDSKILFSRIEDLSDILEKISAFPQGEKEERRKRFVSQLLAWKWYYSEGVKKNNKYLVFLSIQKIILFSSRIILNENEILYPYHKWMLEELKVAKRKPIRILDSINKLFEIQTVDEVEKYCKEILDFIEFNEKLVDWPNYFLKDSEQNWINHEPPVDDL